MMLESLQVNLTEDVERYISLVKDGQIYEYLLKEFQSYGLDIHTRDEVKKLFLKILFDRNSHNSPARKVFNTLFPEVSRVFSLVRGERKGGHFVNFKRFAILLQRIESYIVLDKILLRINQERPGMIAVTIHDSVMTDDNPQNIAYVKQVMLEELTKEVGKEPKIKVESNGKEDKEIKKIEGITVLEFMV